MREIPRGFRNSEPLPERSLVREAMEDGAVSSCASGMQDDGLDCFGGDSDAPSQSSFSLNAILRHKWLMIAAFILVAGAAIPPIWLFVVPLYSSTAIVRVAPVRSRLVFSTETNKMVPLYRNYLNTQVSTIRSPRVLRRALGRKDIQETQWYKEGGKRLLRDELPALDRLAKEIAVQPGRDSELIEVSVAVSKGSEAKILVDAVVDEYDKLMRERENEDYLNIIEIVTAKDASLEKRIKGLQETRYNLSKSLGLMDSVELRTQLSMELNELESNSRKVKRDLAILSARLEQATGQDAQADKDTPEKGADEEPPRPGYSEDPEWRGLKRSLDDAGHELKKAGKKFGQDHYRIEELTAEMEHAQALLDDRESQLNEQADREAKMLALGGGSVPALPGMASLGQTLSEKELERTILQQDIDRQRAKVKDIQLIARHEEQIREAQHEFEDVRQRLTELKTENEAPGRVSVLSDGLSSAEPSRDRRLLLTVMALGGALMFSLAVGYLRAAMDSRIHGLGDIHHVARMPFFGRLPLLPKNSIPRELGGTAGPTMVSFQGGDDTTLAPSATNDSVGLMESMRMVRTALLERLEGSRERVILVTSPTAQVGKTSVALLLARSLVAIGKKVLLVEGDFYRPSLSSRLGVEPQEGLASLLSGERTGDGVIRQTTLANLDFLPMGEITECFNREALANGIFASCVARWRENYDFVLLDSPPVLPVADARILAGHADGALLVLRAMHSRRQEATEACRQLGTTRSGLLGCIFIGNAEHEGYGYGYGDYGYAGVDPDGHTA